LRVLRVSAVDSNPPSAVTCLEAAEELLSVARRRLRRAGSGPRLRFALEVIDDRLRELLQIVGLAARDPVAVAYHRLVADVGADLREIVLDGLPGGERAALH